MHWYYYKKPFTRAKDMQCDSQVLRKPVCVVISDAHRICNVKVKDEPFVLNLLYLT